jgi:predicted nucleotidyltransferase
MMEADGIIRRAADALKGVRGIEAVVLGGSRARGTATGTSDIDIGIYYSDPSALDLAELERIAANLDDAHRSELITPIGEWGPWINGGGWLTIGGIATDFLFRDLNKISRVLADCLEGNITIDYQAGHPHGFVNSIYAAEIFYCRILWDASGRIAELKDKVTPYPSAIREGTVRKFLWEAGFFAGIAGKSLPKRDIAYTAGCLYRVASCLVQVVFALNKTYLMNEKGALAKTDAFTIIPKGFRGRVEELFGSITTEPNEMKERTARLSELVKEVEALCGAH